jgi:Protein of unknown function (DUF2568)
VNALHAANLVVRFLLELAALAATAYWGYETGSGALRVVLAIGAPLLVIAVWWAFVSPKPRLEVPRPLKLAIEFAVFGAAAAGLWATGRHTLALAFGAIALVSGTLNYRWS